MTVMIPEAAEAAEGESAAGGESYLQRIGQRRAARQDRQSFSQYSPPAAQGSANPPGNQRQSQSAGGPNITITGGTTYHRWVMAEFIGCVVLTGMTPLLNEPKDVKGQPITTQAALFGADALLRLTALSVVFFILALLSNHEKSGKFAAAFGGLITAGLLVHTSPSLWKKIDAIFGGQVGSGQQPKQTATGSTATGGAGSFLKDVENAASSALKNIISWG
jgi:hypothetical protein